MYGKIGQLMSFQQISGQYICRLQAKSHSPHIGVLNEESERRGCSPEARKILGA